MKRLLIILFIYLLGGGGGQTTQAQTIEEVINELHDKLGLTPEEYIVTFKKLMTNFDEDVTGVSGMQLSSNTKCFYMMILYAFEYEDHVRRINNATDCQEKYDKYGVLLMYIAASTADRKSVV